MKTGFITCMRWYASALLIMAASAAHAQASPDEAPTDTISDHPEPTRAEKAKADKDARVLYERGVVAYEQGNYRDAWDHFRNAYLLSKRPALLYNIGQAADRLRMDHEARDAFRLYLKQNPDAENRREVENRVRALDEQLGDSAEAPASPTYTADTLGTATVPEPEEETKPVEAPSDGQPTRTGFHVRLGLGFGALYDSIGQSNDADSISSGTLSVHVGLGYGVSERVVLGGGLFSEVALTPTVTFGDTSMDIRKAQLNLAFAFISYYLNPRENGWHLLGGIGVGGFSFSDSSASVETSSEAAGALILGGGYEWPFGEEWALGALLRMTLVHAEQDTATHDAFLISALATATWY